MTEPSPAIVDVRQISKFFDSGANTVRALDDVSVAIRRNEFFTLLGPSGCGKTTLLRLIAGFEQPTRGEIFLDGAPIARLPPFERPVNTVFQSYALFPHLTIAQNIAFGLEMRKLGKAEIETTVRAMLELVHLPDVGGRKPAQLSGGQQQRIALARALANRPKVLLLDEPLSALDLKLRKEMQIELKRIQHETGITFVFVTHDQGEALAMSDRIAVIEKGHILQVGAPAEIYERPSHRFVADFIGETNFLPARIIGTDRAALRDGHEVAVAPHRLAAGTEVTLAVRPERAALAAPGGNGAVAGTVRNVVYVGTDTVYHLDLPGVADEPFLIRTQNRGGAARDFQVNDSVEVTVPADALQVLVD